MIDLTANGPSAMAMVDLTRRANRLGIDTNGNVKPLVLTEQEQIRNYISTNPRLGGNEYRYDYDTNDTNTNKSE